MILITISLRTDDVNRSFTNAAVSYFLHFSARLIKIALNILIASTDNVSVTASPVMSSIVKSLFCFDVVRFIWMNVDLANQGKCYLLTMRVMADRNRFVDIL